MWLFLLTALASEVPTLDAVLASTERHFPTVVAAVADAEAATADLLGARGAFDPRLTSALSAGVVGKDQLVTSSTISVPTTLWGMDLAVGHHLGTGTFKSWEGDGTGPSGELAFDLALPLLAGGFTDSDRTALVVSATRRAEAEARVEARRIEAARAARDAWYKWLGAGEKLRIATSAADVAQRVAAGTQTRVERGDLAPIELLDAQRVLAERQVRVVEAQRDVTIAAARLGLYLRDDAGQPLPPLEHAPPALEPPAAVTTTADEALQAALASRPELAILRQRAEAAQARVRLATVSLMPKLDLKLGLDQPLDKDEKTELKIGALLDVPLLQRTSRGRFDRSWAEQQIVQAETQLAADRVAVEVRTALTTLQTASERVALVEQQAKLAAQLEDATRRGYDAGDRSLFDVYLREQSRLSAESGRVDALVDRHLAEAELLAVLGQR